MLVGAIPLASTCIRELLASNPTGLLVFADTVVPLSLQTEEYAEMVISGAPGLPPSYRAARLDDRMRMQDLIRQRVPSIHVVIDSALLKRPGAHACLRKHLGAPGLTIQLLPEDGVPERFNGNFMLFTFADRSRVLVFDTFQGAQLEQREELVSEAVDVFGALAAGALSADETQLQLLPCGGTR